MSRVPYIRTPSPRLKLRTTASKRVGFGIRKHRSKFRTVEANSDLLVQGRRGGAPRRPVNHQAQFELLGRSSRSMFLSGLVTKYRPSVSLQLGFASSPVQTLPSSLEAVDVEGLASAVARRFMGAVRAGVFGHTPKEDVIEDTERDTLADGECDSHCETRLYIGSLILPITRLFGPVNSWN